MNDFNNYALSRLCEKVSCKRCPLNRKEACYTYFEELPLGKQAEILNELFRRWKEKEKNNGKESLRKVSSLL